MSIGLFVRRLTETSYANRPCLFLDRDGVIVEEVNFLHRLEDIVLIPGVAEAIARANRAHIAVVMVTNQTGVARGFYSWEAFAAVQEAIFAHLARAAGAQFSMVLACAYHAEGIGEYAITDHPWRKPNPGMLLKAAQTLRVNLARSFVVGDRLSDLSAGRAAGLPGGALVRTGYGVQEWAQRGEAQFSEWSKEGYFSPRCAENAAVAIRQWLDELTVSESG